MSKEFVHITKFNYLMTTQEYEKENGEIVSPEERSKAGKAKSEESYKNATEALNKATEATKLSDETKEAMRKAPRSDKVATGPECKRLYALMKSNAYDDIKKQINAMPYGKQEFECADIYPDLKDVLSD